jgi:hypothetical protein
VTFDCDVDPAAGQTHEDFSLRAFPNGKISEKGCGSKQGGGSGGPVLVDVVRVAR